MSTKKEKTLGADDVINQIAETLCQASGEFIEEIANKVLTLKVVYQGDSIYTQEDIE
jgi:hypothetical protein